MEDSSGIETPPVCEYVYHHQLKFQSIGIEADLYVATYQM